MYKAIFDNIPMGVFADLSKEIKNEPDVWSAVTLHYEGTNLIGNLMIECSENRSSEYEKALKILLDKLFMHKENNELEK